MAGIISSRATWPLFSRFPAYSAYIRTQNRPNKRADGLFMESQGKTFGHID